MSEITDPNCIVKAFENSDIAILKETADECSTKYWFRASDIEKTIGLVNIRASIQNYTEREKGVKDIDTLGGRQKAVFLSSQGVYRLLYSSKKKNAEKFREWVGDILDDIIFNHSKNLQNQIQSYRKDLEEQQQQICLVLDDGKNKIKLNRHETLIEKFKNKKCVYLIEIDNDKVKVGSTRDVLQRIGGIRRTWGDNCVFLDIFEHQDYTDIERDILLQVEPYLYRAPINDHISKEVVKFTSEFKYPDLLTVVKKTLQKCSFLTPKEKLEKQKLDIIQYFIEKKDSLTDILRLFDSSTNTANIGPVITQQTNEENDPGILAPKEHIQISYNSVNLHTNTRRMPPKGRKILKIDPEDITRILKTYESMVYLLGSPEGQILIKSGIQNAIKKSTIYKNFRWAFEKTDIKDTVILKNKPIIQPIIQLDNAKTKIMKTFSSKDEMIKELKIGKLAARNIILDQTMHNDFYYIEYSSCPEELIREYGKPILRYRYANSVKVKQINPLSGTSVIFNSYQEISQKLGICSKTIVAAVKNKSICQGSLWEFADKSKYC